MSEKCASVCFSSNKYNEYNSKKRYVMSSNISFHPKFGNSWIEQVHNWGGIESDKIDSWVGWEDTNIVPFLNELGMNSSWNNHSYAKSANANREGIM